ncbi:hypothetical protein B0H15DRAFT_838967 [Mycena belliarum]|uniref:Uncharacterized protein n=1 Tax=Mycena belliarum TaxID=1033014 RepID=A0AAD6U9A9_9AGAR|nr:hypothetical protein B0H15DRAFT_838967 [Mycena belliae]
MSTSDYSPLSPYSPFFVSGLKLTVEHDSEPPRSPGDLAYFPASPTYASRTRKRRSSITISASPVSAMKHAKSPARAAGNAWHIASVASNSPSRSRSGSNVASEDTSMLGRIRSGSMGPRLRSKKSLLTNRRPLALFAPTAPPPTAPLPALPLCAPARPALSHLAIQPLPATDVFCNSPVSAVPSSPNSECYHASNVWMGFGAIDEEMKEN